MNGLKIAFITKKDLGQTKIYFNEFKIKDIAEFLEEDDYIEDLIKKIDDCSNKTLEGIFLNIKKCKKKIKGEMKQFIIDYIYE